jgi:hypothetical protein
MLDIAAAHTDHSLRMGPAASTDHRPVFLIRNRSNGAGIDDISVTGFFKGANVMAQLPEQLLHGLCFILIGLATQGIKSELHVNSTKIKKIKL